MTDQPLGHFDQEVAEMMIDRHADTWEEVKILGERYKRERSEYLWQQERDKFLEWKRTPRGPLKKA